MPKCINNSVRTINKEIKSVSVSGSRQAKIVPKKEKIENFMFEEFSVGLEASGA
jgi:hypothetical protein